MNLIVQTENGQEVYEFKSGALDSGAESAVVSAEVLKDGIMLELNETGPEAASNVKHTFELGSISGVPEFKTEMERQCVGSGWYKICMNVPVLYTRTSRVVLYADVLVPASINALIVNRLKTCAIGAIATAGLTAAIGSPAAAIPAFKTSLYACLKDGAGALVSSIEASLYVTQTSGDWRRSS
jgi:hypothetical protein